MKISVAVLLFFVSVSCSAQFYAGIGAGVSITKASPAIQLQIGYDFKALLVQVGYHTHIDRVNPAVFNARLGKTISLNETNNIVVTAGYGNELTSLDKVGGSRNVMVVGMEYMKIFNRNSAWFVELTGAGGNVFITGGLKYIF